MGFLLEIHEWRKHTMIYQSTRGASAPVNSAQAVLKGLADDGGLI